MTSTNLHSLPDARDLFDVRTKILQHTNPLRAKILVFSVVYRPFDFTPQNWMALKSKEFYDLLKRLRSNFETFVELEGQLYETARNIETNEDDRHSETARIVAKYAQRLYDDISTSDLSASEIEPEPSEFGEDDDETQLFDIENSEVAWEDTQLEVDPNSQELENRDKSLFSVDLESSLETSQPISYVEIGNSETNSQLSYDDSEPISELAGADESQESAIIFDRNLEFTEQSIDFESVDRIENSSFEGIIESSPPAEDIFKIADRVADSLFRKMNLEEEIQNLVNQQVKDATLAFQNTLSEVESRLEDTLSNEPNVEGLFLKYQALQMLTDKLQSHLGTIKEILVQQERALISSDRDNSNADLRVTDDMSEASEIDDRPTTGASELLPPKAFIDRLDLALKSRNITTMGTVKKACLYISFEGDRELNPDKILAFVKKKIVDLNLDLDSIERIKVRGRTRGNPNPDWTEIIYP
ncbi:MAG: hypothetical protein SWY16_11880 [Cyanobacteriota bacterium]|nr:hypothetical protein [Cyanobacteriota bacterium]